MTTPAGPERDRYQRVAALFHRALDLPAVERAAFLDGLAQDDATLAAEVRSLVGAHERAAGFIEQPALSGLAPLGATRVELPTEPIGHYRVLGLAGQGGMGVVYLAEDMKLGRTVALKAIRPDSATDDTRKARLRREARAAAALVHPNIATVYALEEFGDRLYVTSEFVAGETLRDELSRGALPPARVARVAVAIARALDAAHTRGIIHRDLKPENVITTDRGDVKVLDFGLAQFADPAGQDGLTKEGLALGTPAYMSPEQIRGQNVDGRSDLFAWGVVVVELLTGRHPFAAATPAATIARVLEEPPAGLESPQVAELRATDSTAATLVALAQRCLAKDAAARPPSAAEIVAALEAVQQPGGPAVQGSSSPAVRPSRRPAVQPSGGAAAWWWQFHQAATTLAYVLFLIPLWRTRTVIAPGWGRVIFLVGLVAVVVSGMLRLHLWFARRQYPGDWAADHRLTRRLIRAGDLILALALFVQGALLANVDDQAAPLLIAAAASVVVSFSIIERGTERAMGRAGG